MIAGGRAVGSSQPMYLGLWCGVQARARAQVEAWANGRILPSTRTRSGRLAAHDILFAWPDSMIRITQAITDRL